MIYPVPKLIPVYDNDSRFQVMIAGILVTGKIDSYVFNGERFKEHSIEWNGYDYNVYFDENGEMYFDEVEMLLGVVGIIKPKNVEFAEGECDDCGDYCVCDIHLPSGEIIYFETHFGNTNFPNGWEEFFEIVEREREVLRSRR